MILKRLVRSFRIVTASSLSRKPRTNGAYCIPSTKLTGRSVTRMCSRISGYLRMKTSAQGEKICWSRSLARHVVVEKRGWTLGFSNHSTRSIRGK